MRDPQPLDQFRHATNGGLTQKCEACRSMRLPLLNGKPTEVSRGSGVALGLTSRDYPGPWNCMIWALSVPIWTFVPRTYALFQVRMLLMLLGLEDVKQLQIDSHLKAMVACLQNLPIHAAPSTKPPNFSYEATIANPAPNPNPNG